jgi:alpha-mannosidase
LTVVEKENKSGSLEGTHSYLEISDPYVGLCAMKKADGDDAVILRLVEMEGVDKDIKVRLPFKVKSIVKCNLVEEETGSPVPVDSDVLEIHLGHNSIETFKLI